ncbi:predicted protein [Uncinocarpus reesii 1704]|uniref:C2H2-type domain-containing protein n=1 Tax=Uncinocarpus reesii (strain UAMH 1704) TaxID=336963 RepID=C4JP57_UNCRE|nr:uncharacterized protein UREG_03116 [Uncinocarpus reesii 1704]EEP78271.1 predicted protein [Uncinocarpus reesii 1704]
MVNLGRYVPISYDSDDSDFPPTRFACAFCCKEFGTFKALHQHCRMTSRHEWCARCDRAFCHERALAAHVRYSSSHHECPRCDFDFTTAAGLNTHRAEAHHWCVDCDEYFQNNNSLRMLIPHPPLASINPPPPQPPMLRLLLAIPLLFRNADPPRSRDVLQRSQHRRR